MKKLKIGLIITLISALIAVFAMAGCNESKLNTGSNTLNPNVAALNAKGGLQVSLNFIKKSMSTKASDISDVIESVTFHITGTNLPAPINQIVQRADFKGPGWAVIQINDLLPGTINVTVEAKDANGNVIATGHQDNITVIPGDTIRIRIDCVINVGSVIIDFVCINCLPTPTVTIPASIDPPSPMPTVCCPVTSSPDPYGCAPLPTPANTNVGKILIYTTGGWAYNKNDFAHDLLAILHSIGYTADLVDRDGNITASLLNGYDQLWIMTTQVNNTVLNENDFNAIDTFRNNNKGVLVSGEDANYYTDANFITGNWGINFVGIYNDASGASDATFNINHTVSHPLFNNVNSLMIGMDSGILNQGIGYYDTDKTQPFVAVLDESNKGRVVVDGSFGKFWDSAYSHSGSQPGCCNCFIRAGDSLQYTKNIAEWLQRRL